MRMKSVTLKIMVFTVGCFMLSYAASVVAGINTEKPYPASLAKAYAKKGSEGDLHTVTVKKIVPAAGIHDLSIASVRTDVEIKQVDGDQITLDLKGQFENENPLEVVNQGGELAIKIKENSDHDHFFNFNFDSGDSHLKLGIPKSITEVAVKSVSGDLKANGLKLERMKLETVSGDSNIEKTGAEQMELKSVSGDVFATGNIGKFTAHSVSGDVRVQFENSSPNIELKTTSGDTSVEFKKKPDLKVEFSSISGSFKLDREFGDTEVEGRKFSLNLGEGKGSLAVKTISGDVKIEKF